MGLYRLLLAVMVAISHTEHRLFGFNVGVVAVISFFILSGYVMTVLVGKHYKSPSSIPNFYLDRAARLFPQYTFYLLLATACIYIFGIDSGFVSQLDLVKWALNLLILPLGFYMYWADYAMVIPPAWSVGLEMMFYLVIPWMLIYCSRKQIYLTAGASFLVFLAAYFGYINTGYFGYRLLPGTLFIFLIGWSFYNDDSASKRFRRALFFASSALLVFACANRKFYELPYNKEVLAGLLIGVLAVGYLRRFKFSRIDEFFGNLSYGVFLNHMLVMWLIQRFSGIKDFDSAHITAMLLISFVLAICTFFLVERPALKWRHGLRYSRGQ